MTKEEADARGVKVKPLEWTTRAKGFPETAVDSFGGTWDRWFINDEYYRDPEARRRGLSGRKGIADSDYEARVLGALL